MGGVLNTMGLTVSGLFWPVLMTAIGVAIVWRAVVPVPGKAE
jgi:hypothetical protein